MRFSTLLTRSSLFAPIAAAGALLLSGVAQADPPNTPNYVPVYVHSARAWDAGFQYEARFNLDGREQPRLNPVAKVDYVKQGQWVHIKCQVTGGYAYGSTIWDRVDFDGGSDGYYVPDAYIRTFTTRFLKGAPRCS